MTACRTLLTILALATALAGCTTSRSELRERVAQWQSTIDAKVPRGTPVNDVIIWGSRNGVSFAYAEDHESIYAYLEKVPERGIGSVVCSHWSILLTMHLAADGTTTDSEVRTVGTCL